MKQKPREKISKRRQGSWEIEQKTKEILKKMAKEWTKCDKRQLKEKIKGTPQKRDRIPKG